LETTAAIIYAVYTKGSIDAGMVEFDISTKKYKSVTAFERADENYFIILIPKSTSISDSAIAQLESVLMFLTYIGSLPSHLKGVV
jgi:hypothetical protein